MLEGTSGGVFLIGVAVLTYLVARFVVRDDRRVTLINEAQI